MTGSKRERSFGLKEQIQFFEARCAELREAEETASRLFGESVEQQQKARELLEKTTRPEQLRKDAESWEESANEVASNPSLSDEIEAFFRRRAEDIRKQQKEAEEALSEKERREAEAAAQKILTPSDLQALNHDLFQHRQARQEVESTLRALYIELTKAEITEAEKVVAQAFLENVSSVIQDNTRTPSTAMEKVVDALRGVSIGGLSEASLSGWGLLLEKLASYFEGWFDNWSWFKSSEEESALHGKLENLQQKIDQSAFWDDDEVDESVVGKLAWIDGTMEGVEAALQSDQEDVVKEHELIAQVYTKLQAARKKIVRSVYEDIQSGPPDVSKDEKIAWAKEQDKIITRLSREYRYSQSYDITRSDWEELLQAQARIKAWFVTLDMVSRGEHSYDASLLDEAVARFKARLDRPMPEDTKQLLGELLERLEDVTQILENPLLKLKDRLVLNQHFVDIRFQLQRESEASFRARLEALNKQVSQKKFWDDDERDKSLDGKLAWIEDILEDIESTLENPKRAADKALLLKVRDKLQKARLGLHKEKSDLEQKKKSERLIAKREESKARLQHDIKSFKKAYEQSSDRSVFETRNMLSDCTRLLENPKLPYVEAIRLRLIQGKLQREYTRLLSRYQQKVSASAHALLTATWEDSPSSLTSLDEKISYWKKKNEAVTELMFASIKPREEDMKILVEAQKLSMEKFGELMREKYGPAAPEREKFSQERREDVDMYRSNLHMQITSLLEEVLDDSTAHSSEWQQAKLALVARLQAGVIQPTEEDIETLKAIQLEIQAGRPQVSQIEEPSEEPVEKRLEESPSPLPPEDLPTYEPVSPPVSEQRKVPIKSSQVAPAPIEEVEERAPTPLPIDVEVQRGEQTEDGQEDKSMSPTTIARTLTPGPVEEGKEPVKSQQRKRSAAPAGVELAVTQIWDLVQVLEEALKTSPGEASLAQDTQVVLTFIEIVGAIEVLRVRQYEDREAQEKFNQMKFFRELGNLVPFLGGEDLDVLEYVKNETGAKGVTIPAIEEALRRFNLHIKEMQRTLKAQNIPDSNPNARALAGLMGQLGSLKRLLDDRLLKIVQGVPEVEQPKPPPPPAPPKQALDRKLFSTNTLTAYHMIESLNAILFTGEVPEEKVAQNVFVSVYSTLKNDEGQITKEKVERLIQQINNSITAELESESFKKIPYTRREANKQALKQLQEQALPSLILQFEREHEEVLAALNSDEESPTPG